MPRGDGTGPAGMGPMTGRAAGYCAEYSMPGFMNPIPGGGFRSRGRGFRGRGHGWGCGFGMGFPAYAPAYGAWGGQVTPQQELDALKGQAEYFEDALEGVQQRIEELESEAKKKK